MGFCIACATLLAFAAPTTLADGHADVASARIVGGKLRAYVKDDTRGKTQWRAPESVLLGVGDRAKLRLPAGLEAVGRAGETVWMLPQTQRRGVLWAGWNTESIRATQIRGGLSWTLRTVTGPGRVVLFQTGSFGDERVLFTTGRRLPQTQTIAAGTHAHGNWAFTRPGTYRLTYSMSVRTRAGKTLSDTATLTYRVG